MDKQKQDWRPHECVCWSHMNNNPRYVMAVARYDTWVKKLARGDYDDETNVNGGT